MTLEEFCSHFVTEMCKSADCYAITIVVEGGQKALNSIKCELDNCRPVVLIHGSGRFSNLIGDLLEKLDDQSSPK